MFSSPLVRLPLSFYLSAIWAAWAARCTGRSSKGHMAMQQIPQKRQSSCVRGGGVAGRLVPEREAANN